MTPRDAGDAQPSSLRRDDARQPALQPLSWKPPKDTHTRTVIRIPQSHTLYVGPASCIRRHMLRAFTYEDSAHVSYLNLDMVSLAQGKYTSDILDAARELMRTVQPAPRLVIITLFCIDDFLATDEEALIEELERQTPGVRYVVEHIHPVMLDERHPMSFDKAGHHYALLAPVAPETRDRGIMFVGSFAPLPEDCEVFDLLKRWEIGPVRQLFACKTYDDYVSLAKSRIGLIVRPCNPATTADIQTRLGIPLVEAPCDFGLDRIMDTYERLARLIGADRPDPGIPYLRAQASIEQALAIVGQTPICVGCQASLRPFALARALLQYGFCVTHIVRSRHVFDFDEADRVHLSRQYPNIIVVRDDDASWVQTARSNIPANMIAIGTDAQRMFHATACVDMWHDEGFYGFQGVRALMDMLIKAAQTLQALQAESRAIQGDKA